MKAVELVWPQLLCAAVEDADQRQYPLLRQPRNRPCGRAGKSRDELPLVSFNHLVGGQKEARRNCQVKLFRGFEIDGHFIPGWGLHRQVGGLVTA